MLAKADKITELGIVAPTLWWDLTDALEQAADQLTRLVWPDRKYFDDIVGFARDILGVELYDKQIEVANDVAEWNAVAVRSGHKIGKSLLAVVIALWWYCTRDRARVIFTSTTSRQVDEILWYELQSVMANAGRCVACRKLHSDGEDILAPCPHSSKIDGTLASLARNGLKADDRQRQIWGFTAKEAEAVAGISGPAMLFICDEASGIPQIIYNAIRGNRMGGGKILLLGNPTNNEGEHYEAFHSKSKIYRTHTISSEDTPNYKSRKYLIPGLATYEEVEQAREEWGEDNAQFIVRVQGKHALSAERKIFNVAMLEAAQARGDDYESARKRGEAALSSKDRLFIGIDPAGESGAGDDSAFAARRGMNIFRLATELGLTPVDHADYVERWVDELRLDRRELKPVVVIDKGGKVGSRVFKALIDRAEQTGKFEVVGVDASDDAVRDQRHYEKMRDLLTANFYDWMRAGGSIPRDLKLETECHIWEWIKRANGKLRLHPDKFGSEGARRRLGRSPDRYDACTLCAWVPRMYDDQQPADKPAVKRQRQAHPAVSQNGIDPFAGRSGEGGISPWG